MGRRPKWGEPVDGLLLLNKACGVSSNHALQQVKRLFNARRAGHTGALDPLATGMLPICLGEATKFTQFLLDSDKTYIASTTFGITTDSGDSDGSETSRKHTQTLTQATLETTMEQFRGSQLQTPPQYSALKHKGKPLYEYARQGIEVVKEPRPITIYELQLLKFSKGEFAQATFLIRCSKGTYIRSLVADIGNEIGCGAHVTALHRTQVSNFKDTMYDISSLSTCYTPKNLRTTLLPVDSCVSHLTPLHLTVKDEVKLLQGQPLSFDTYQSVLLTAKNQSLVRCYNTNAEFIGIARVDYGKYVKPQRIINQLQN